MTGLGAMIRDLGGYEDSVDAYRSIDGKTIESVSVVDDAVRFTMADGTVVELFDDGQTCCEHRYLTTDDDLSHYAGAMLVTAEVRDVGEVKDPGDDESEWADVHECSFLIVTTSKGQFTVKAHNKHNGYYGGIRIVARRVK